MRKETKQRVFNYLDYLTEKGTKDIDWTHLYQAFGLSQKAGQPLVDEWKRQYKAGSK